MHQVELRKGGLGGRAETTLWQQAQAGCRQSLNQLMREHDGLVQAVVRQQILGELPYEMALQAGRTGLWRAILGYDCRRGTAFSTYAWPAIMRAVWAAVKAESEGKGGGPLPMTLVDEGQEPERQWEREVVRVSIRAAVATLPERLQRVVQSRYGWEGEGGATFGQIGAELGVTRQRAHQLYQEALLRLRQPGLSYPLRSWLEKQSASDYQAVAVETAAWLQRRGGRG